jgi:cell division transport system ATP-binding protein
VISLYEVSKRYGDHIALHDVSLSVGKGEFCYLTGPSGAGKSTLMKLLYCAERCTSGTVMIGGTNVADIPRRQVPLLRRNLGIVFQDFKLIPSRTVGENVALALEVLGASRETINRRVRAVLGTVGLKGRENDLPATLSGGEQQRVAVARALVNDPAILLADEPTGNLDGAMAIEVIEILRAVNIRGATVLLATHDTALMDRFPAQRIQLRAGRLSQV